MSLLPKDLPKLRDQTLRHLNDASSALRSGIKDDHQEGLDILASNLAEAGLYWVSQDMAALAVSAGSQLAAARWDRPARPSDRGLILFDEGIGHLDAQGVSIPVEACSWGPHPQGCVVWLLLSRARMLREMTRTDLQVIVDQVPPLVPVYGFVVPTGPDQEPVPMVDIDPHVPQTITSALAAAWLLMEQPTLVEARTERPDRAVRKAYARQNRPAPEVTLVDLRRQFVPQQQDDVGQERQRRYRHRFVVSGHWRNQAYGPERALRRQTWIPAYVKGPDGAPMLASEKVNVWRR